MLETTRDMSNNVIVFDVTQHAREVTSAFIAMVFLWMSIAGEVKLGSIYDPLWVVLGMAIGVMLHELAHIGVLRLLGVRGVEVKFFSSRGFAGFYVKPPGHLSSKSFVLVALSPLLALTPTLALGTRLAWGPAQYLCMGAGFITTAGSAGDILLAAVASSVRGARIADRGVAVEIQGCCLNPLPLLPIIYLDYLVWLSLPTLYVLPLLAQHMGGLYAGPIPLVRIVTERTGTGHVTRMVEEPALYALLLVSALIVTMARWRRRVDKLLSG